MVEIHYLMDRCILFCCVFHEYSGGLAVYSILFCLCFYHLFLSMATRKKTAFF